MTELVSQGNSPGGINAVLMWQQVSPSGHASFFCWFDKNAKYAGFALSSLILCIWPNWPTRPHLRGRHCDVGTMS